MPLASGLLVAIWMEVFVRPTMLLRAGVGGLSTVRVRFVTRLYLEPARNRQFLRRLYTLRALPS